MSKWIWVLKVDFDVNLYPFHKEIPVANPNIEISLIKDIF